MDRDLIVSLCRTDFPSFVRFAFGEAYPSRDLIGGWHLDLMCDYLMRCGPKGERRLILNAPPRYLKSFCTSIAWPLFLLASEPGLRGVVITGTRELAADFSELRRRLLRSQRLQAAFPELKVKATNDELQFANGSRLVQTFIGHSQIGRGADLLILDDPLRPAHAWDRGRRDAVHNWYAAEVLPRLNGPNATLVVVMQRLHADDLCGRLLKGDGAWLHLSLAAINRTEERWRLSDGAVVGRAGHEPLCAMIEGKSELKDRLYAIGAQNFCAQYIQAPRGTPTSSNRRAVYVPPRVYDGWAPGMPTLHGGFFKISITDEIYLHYFAPNAHEQSGKIIRIRDRVVEEWEKAAIVHQSRLVASCQP